MDITRRSHQPLLDAKEAAYWCWYSYRDYTFQSFNHQTEVFFKQFDDYRIIVVRGSDEIGDWLDHNLNIRPATMHSGMKVQAGYLNAFSGVYYPLIETVTKSNPNLPLYCLGHSLGAAVAGICADIFEADAYFSFACPRFACPGYAEYLKNKIPYQKRIAFWNDPVQYAGNFFRYRHTCPVTWIKPLGWCPPFPHSAELYARALH